MMEYEWDEGKATANLRKHRVDFADAVGVFDDPLALSMHEATVHELRHVVIGLDVLGRTLVVIYTCRGERTRIVSARFATPNERRTYERGSR